MSYACEDTRPRRSSSDSVISVVATVTRQSPKEAALDSRFHERLSSWPSPTRWIVSGIQPVSAYRSMPELEPGKS